MNVLCRPLVAAFICLSALLAGLPAFGQFLDQEILQADSITPPMIDAMTDVIDPEMDRLISGEPESISKARKNLIQLLNYQDASKAFRIAFSTQITKRMDGAVNHDDTLVRMNAMIILNAMVDDDSKALIDSGLEDDSDAVKRWAMKALGSRCRWWRGQGANAQDVADAIKQIVAQLDQNPPPHPIVVDAGLEALLNADSPAARSALVDQLNKRVALHAADSSLSYSPERVAIERFSGVLSLESKKDFQSTKDLSRAMYRYASLIITQVQAGGMSEDQRLGALTMLLESMQGLVRTTLASKAKPPVNHPNAKNWIQNGGWVDLKNLVEKDWAAILTGNPFNLKPDQLAVGKEEALAP